MSILDDMMKKVQREQYNRGDLSIDRLKEVFDALFYRKREPNRPFVIHTGIWGMYTFDYYTAMESGVISHHMTKQHGKLMRMMGMGMNPGKVVDENGIVWMTGRIKGKGWYFSNMHQRTSPARTTSTRFRIWVWALERQEEPARKPFTTYGYDTAIERYREKLEARRTGIRRKGTLTPDEGAMRRGY